MPHHRHHLVSACIVGYAAGVTVWYALRWLFFDDVWWLAMVNMAALALFVPLPLLGAVALLRRRWRLLILLLVPALLGMELYGARFLPHARPKLLASTPRITAMTFNVLYRNRADDALETTITSSDADLVGLQELTPKRARWFEATLAAEYPHMAFRVDGPEAGVGLLSRHPIVEVTRFDLPPRNLALHVVVEVEGTLLDVLASVAEPRLTHAAATYRRRRAALLRAQSRRGAKGARRAARRDRTATGAVRLQHDRKLRRLRPHGHCAERQLSRGRLGSGPYFRGPGVPLLVQRVDYVWHSPELTAESAWVGPAGGSDHRPVVARLSFAPTPNTKPAAE